MILTGQQILSEIKNGSISIEPFDVSKLNPNSYNLTLSDKLLVYELPFHSDAIKDCGRIAPGPYTFMEPIDMKSYNKTLEIKIPEDGYVLQPGVLYLGETVEYTQSFKHVPCLEGRSSVGRLGINIHATAGFGDIGFCGKWTLEISCVQPVKIYPFIEICQIYYHEAKGEVVHYNGKYQYQETIQPSKFYLD